MIQIGCFCTFLGSIGVEFIFMTPDSDFEDGQRNALGGSCRIISPNPRQSFLLTSIMQMKLSCTGNTTVWYSSFVLSNTFIVALKVHGNKSS